MNFEKRFNKNNLKIKIKQEGTISAPSFVVQNEMGKKIGYAIFNFKRIPFRHYYLTDFNISKKFRGRGHASILIERVNFFLQEKKMIGRLNNGIHTSNYKFPEVSNIETKKIINPSDFYSRHGWEYIDKNHPYMFYNPTDESDDRIRKRFLNNY